MCHIPYCPPRTYHHKNQGGLEKIAKAFSRGTIFIKMHFPLCKTIIYLLVTISINPLAANAFSKNDRH